MKERDEDEYENDQNTDDQENKNQVNNSYRPDVQVNSNFWFPNSQAPGQLEGSNSYA